MNTIRTRGQQTRSCPCKERGARTWTRNPWSRVQRDARATNGLWRTSRATRWQMKSAHLSQRVCPVGLSTSCVNRCHAERISGSIDDGYAIRATLATLASNYAPRVRCGVNPTLAVVCHRRDGVLGNCAISSSGGAGAARVVISAPTSDTSQTRNPGKRARICWARLRSCASRSCHMRERGPSLRPRHA